MRLQDKGAATAVAAVLGGLLFVPSALAGAVEPQHPTVAAGTRATLNVAEGAISVHAPAGWAAVPTVSSTRVLYRHDGRTLDIRAVGGVGDQDVAARRSLAALSRVGIGAAFNGGHVSTSSGFAGRTCQVVRPSQQTLGRCVVVGRDAVQVTILSTAPGGTTPADVLAVADSLTFTPAAPPAAAPTDTKEIGR